MRSGFLPPATTLPRGHDRLPSGNLPVSTHWLIGALAPRTQMIMV